MPEPTTRPPVILVADDTDHQRAGFAAVLERAGYVVLQARNGAEALRQARARTPDLVLMDLSMPILDGWEAVEQLRSDETAGHIPVIACTAERSADAESLRRAGFNGLLRKPFVPAQLRRAVADCIGAEGWVTLGQHSMG